MIVRPFKAIRPKKEFASKVAAKPYDVISSEEARKIFKSNPLSFYQINKPEVNFDEPIEPSDDRALEVAKKNLERMIAEKIFIQDEEPCFYVYKQVAPDHVQIGLVATFSVDEYLSNKIKKHELTRKDKEDERVKHILYLKAQTGPVFLMYRSNESIDKLIIEETNKEPEYDFVDEDGVRQVVYLVKDKEKIESIKKAFEKVDSFYIADGHHRAAAAVRAALMLREENKNYTGEEEFNYFLAVLFPHSHLRIYDYNRVVKDLNGLKPEEFLKALEEKFEVQPAPETPYKPKKAHEFGMYLEGKWYVLKITEKFIDASDPVKSLDVSLLQEHVLSPILGIKDPRTDKRIDFVGGIHGLKALEEYVDNKGWAVAFSMYPTSIEDLMKVSDSGQIMPPKSTWFEPKLKSGLFIHAI
ncbi:DUF1015 domain-containing protein [Pseudothermotoga thermarum]|uniref:Uncharacterized conserved protein UCP033563 n=1 Tax=Pseudothermotoga thermarum DSM 5069 TaxID=688269 RepID=F7YTS8_9THEM|nr:DUF1015 family protein [Pseudothermotoga thermarum]AEH51373.1 Uncharacterized conserved protein UCP033563 [Pseudothermotoga thermarum DSM 5069]